MYLNYSETLYREYLVYRFPFPGYTQTHTHTHHILRLCTSLKVNALIIVFRSISYTASPLHANEFRSESVFISPICKCNSVSQGTQLTQLAIK